MRHFSLILFCALSAHAATFGRVVPLVGGGTDLALDEARGRVYLTSSLQNLVQVYSVQRQSFLTPIPTDPTPLSAALSRDGAFLYVTCYDGSVLDVIDLDALTVTARVSLPTRPEGVAVGSDGRVLISTTGSGTPASNVLLLYDPAPDAAVVLTNLAIAPAAPTPPTLPSPIAGRPFAGNHSQLAATRDGSLIVGIHVLNATTVAAFVYETASNTVLRSRVVAGTSTALSISDDGTRFLVGPNLFETATLAVLAQENAANAPYPIVFGNATTNFNTQSSQGGGVFSPDGQTLYAAFDISPVQTPPASPNVSQLMLNDPDNLLIRMGVELPENLAGKMVISSNGANIYALSDSGLTTIPIGAVTQSPLAVPASSVLLLTKDQCGVTAATSSAALAVNNAGGGRITPNAQLATTIPSPPSPATAPSVSSGGGQLSFSFNPAAARGLGTVSPPHDFLIQAPEAVNIPYRVRVFENSRDAEARGTVVPIPVSGAAGESFRDVAFDSRRQRLYIANYGLNRVEVFDTQQQAFLAPIKVGQLPSSMALTPDGDTLYVANSGGESISIIDPDKLQVVGQVAFPPIPFNSNLALATPTVIAAGLSGPQILMSNGTLWKVVGGTAVPRATSRVIGSNVVPAASSMAATPGGEYIFLATSAGNAYLYDATVDDWVTARQVFTAATTPAGYLGPVAAGPKGNYFVMNGAVLNQALTPVASASVPRLVAAVAAADNNTYAIFSPPPAAAANTASTTVPTVQILNAASGASTLQVNALEGPVMQVAATGRATVSGRTMAIDTAGGNAYVVTISGLSIVPLAPVAASDRPQVNKNGAVNLASLQLPVAANGLLAIFGQNMASSASTNGTPLPLVLGGACVTLGTVALPLYSTLPGQIDAQIPPELAPGTYALIVRSIDRHAASASQQLTVSKYAPAVVVDANGQTVLYHADGKLVTKNNPANRDEPLLLYAVGLGPTTGGTVTAGAGAPSNPPAVTGPVEVFFGNPSYKQAAIIVDSSQLAPGWAGLYQLRLRVPGFHMNGDALPVMLRVGGVSSPTSGPVVPVVSVH